MKLILLFFVTTIIVSCSGQKFDIESGTYNIILRTINHEPMGENDTIELPGDLDTSLIQNLDEPLKGLTALYSAMGGSYCNGVSCDLTTALGLGKQGSALHKSLIRKYLPKDSLADFLINQNCYLRPDGASSFNAYKYLTIIVTGDTIKVSYALYNYDHGNEYFNNDCDIYLYKNNCFEKMQRNDKWIK